MTKAKSNDTSTFSKEFFEESEHGGHFKMMMADDYKPLFADGSEEIIVTSAFNVQAEVTWHTAASILQTYARQATAAPERWVTSLKFSSGPKAI